MRDNFSIYEDFERILNAVNDAVMVLDIDHRVVWANRAMSELLNLPLETILEKHCYKLVHNTDWPIDGCLCSLTIKSRERESTELEIPDRGICVRVTTDPYFDKNGNFIGVVHIISDITAIKRAERDLRESSQKLLSLINNVPGVVYRGAPDWSISFMAAEVGHFTGRAPAEFTDGIVDWRSIIHPDDLETVRSAFSVAVRRKERSQRIEYRVKHTEGGYRWIEDRRQMIYDAGDRFTSVEGLLIDISDRKRAEQSLHAATALAQEEKAKAEAIIAGIGDGISIQDREFRVLYQNSVHKKLIGEHTGEFCYQAYENSEHVCERCPVEMTYRDGGIHTEERRVETENAVMYIEITASPLKDISGEITGGVEVVRNITDRKNQERALNESEELLRNVFEGSKDGILLADVESRRFLAGNRAICGMLRYSLDEIRELGVEDIYPEVDLPNILDGFEQQAREEVDSSKDLPFKRKDGSVLFADLRSSLVTVAGKKCLLGSFRDVTERRKREEELTRLHMAVDQAAEAVIITDFEWTIEYVNPAFERITEYSPQEAVGKNPRFLKSGKHDEAFYRTLWETLSQGNVWQGRFVNRKKDGSLYDEEATISPVRNASGKIINFVAVKRDITREVELQRQLQTAQRMEAVGALAGGIAHDFNNALTGIFGFGEMLRLKVADRPEALKDLDTIGECAQQAATLTRQLLTFARRQVIDPVNLDLNVVVTEMEKLVRKVVGEHIEVKTFLAKVLPTARLDRSQVEQVLMNLCLNARDAMPSGGQLLLETADVTTDDEYVEAHPYVTSGRYVLLTVSDTGTGMDPETVEKVFEPFFTTKEVGKGTGLGLSSVYGIVKQSGGFVHVYSEPGKGSSFKVYFPAVDAPPDAVSGKPGKEPVGGGTETILLAEDEESLRKLAVRILDGLGYTVLVARDGEEAVSVFRENPGISLVLLDVVMPGKGGKEAYEEMRKGSQNLKGIFMSGYSANAVHESFVLTPGVPFLTKPYTPSSLGRKVREVLDGK